MSKAAAQEHEGMIDILEAACVGQVWGKLQQNSIRRSSHRNSAQLGPGEGSSSGTIRKQNFLKAKGCSQEVLCVYPVMPCLLLPTLREDRSLQNRQRQVKGQGRNLHVRKARVGHSSLVVFQQFVHFLFICLSAVAGPRASSWSRLRGHVLFLLSVSLQRILST